MALLEKQLVIKKSNLPEAGMGLFTTQKIPKGTRIVEYKGRIRTWKEVQDDPRFNGYVFYIRPKTVIDAMRRKKAFARYANDAKGLRRGAGIKNNAAYIREGDRVYIDATHDIPAGGEIYVSYGKDYWNAVRHNIKHGII
jgi:uncharacterized protein